MSLQVTEGSKIASDPSPELAQSPQVAGGLGDIAQGMGSPTELDVEEPARVGEAVSGLSKAGAQARGDHAVAGVPVARPWSG